MFHAYQWAARFCRQQKPTFVFLDDDYAVNLPLLIPFFGYADPDKLQNFGHGFYFPSNPVHRHTSGSIQWAFSKREVPWPKHMLELLGTYSIWNYQQVHDMALAMHFIRPLVIDDTWLALIQFRLGLKFNKIQGMYFSNPDINMVPNCSQILFAPITSFVKRNCSL